MTTYPRIVTNRVVAAGHFVDPPEGGEPMIDRHFASSRRPSNVKDFRYLIQTQPGAAGTKRKPSVSTVASAAGWRGPPEIATAVGSTMTRASG